MAGDRADEKRRKKTLQSIILHNLLDIHWMHRIVQSKAINYNELKLEKNNRENVLQVVIT